MIRVVPMPRRAKPVAIFRIEGLSDGIDRNMRDDISGELLAQPMAKVPRSVQSYQRGVSDAIAAQRAKVLQALVPKSSKPFKRRV